MTNTRPWSTLIIGCGNIAGGFDMKSDINHDTLKATTPTAAGPCTHAGAYRQQGHFTLSACVDPDRERRQRFQTYWQIQRGYNDIAELEPQQNTFDVISICSPTAYHQQHIEQAIALKPKVIFCEKPITQDIASSQRLVDRCQQHQIAMVVNFTRQWDPDIQHLQQAIATEQYGPLRSIIGTYNKGIFNNGSHLINTLQLLLGELQLEHTLAGIIDYDDTDPSIAALLTSPMACPIHLATAHAEDFTLFEIQFIFQERVIHMLEGGLYWCDRLTKNSQRFAHYTTLDHGTVRQGRYQQAMVNAVDNIDLFLLGKARLQCTGAAALNTQTLCQQLWQQAQNQQACSQ